MPCAPKAVVNPAAYSGHNWRRDALGVGDASSGVLMRSRRSAHRVGGGHLPEPGPRVGRAAGGDTAPHPRQQQQVSRAVLLGGVLVGGDELGEQLLVLGA